MIELEEKFGLEKDNIVTAGPSRGRLATVYRFAQEHSDDPRTKNAAAIYVPRENEPMSIGANEFPDARLILENRTEPPLKYKYLLHAEMNAICNAWKKGRIPKHSVLICPWLTCDSCARLIIKAGISKVIGHYNTLIKSPPRWHEEIRVGLGMLREVGIKIEWYKGEVFSRSSDFRCTFNGEDIQV